MTDVEDSTRQPDPRWHLPPFAAASVLLHAFAPGAVLLQPEAWPLAVGALVGNHALLGIAGLRPRSSLLGPNLNRLPAASAARGAVALTVDDGPDPLVTPQVLDILDRHAVRASFFCVGARALRHPDLCREIVRRGHAVENHSQSHSYLFATFGPRRIARDVDEGQRTLRLLTGDAPRFFRPPAGLRNVFLDPVLARRGLRLASWTRRGFDTRERSPDVVLRRLVRNLRGGDILTLHDGNCARTTTGVPVILEMLPRLLTAIQAAGLHAVTLRSALA
jgi:peptidoglycan/xylan/chitin deacetylase (PgdA/CDA1 family)